MSRGRRLAERPRVVALRVLVAALVVAVALFAGAALSAPDRRGQAQAEQAARRATEKARRLEAAEQQARELVGRLAATTADAQRWRNRARRAERQLNRKRVERRRR